MPVDTEENAKDVFSSKDKPSSMNVILFYSFFSTYSPVKITAFTNNFFSSKIDY